MGDVTKFYSKESASSPDVVLERAVGVYENVFIIGWDKEGALEARANTGFTHENVLWLIEVFKKKLISGDYSDQISEE